MTFTPLARTEILSLIAIGLVNRDRWHPTSAPEQAARLLERHESAVARDAMKICPRCGSAVESMFLTQDV